MKNGHFINVNISPAIIYPKFQCVLPTRLNIFTKREYN